MISISAEKIVHKSWRIDDDEYKTDDVILAKSKKIYFETR